MPIGYRPIREFVSYSWTANPNYDLNDFMMDYDLHCKSWVCQIMPIGYRPIREFVSYSWTANPNYDLNDFMMGYDLH
jgi:Ni,Fe-hydrogenase I large subunit